jgi:hypothetical protein
MTGCSDPVCHNIVYIIPKFPIDNFRRGLVWWLSRLGMPYLLKKGYVEHVVPANVSW